MDNNIRTELSKVYKKNTMLWILIKNGFELVTKNNKKEPNKRNTIKKIKIFINQKFNINTL